MKIMTKAALAATLITGLTLSGAVSAESDAWKADQQSLVDYYAKKFPGVEKAAYADGLYAFDEDSREQWQEIEEFPPYEEFIEVGQELFETPFANGNTYASCFENGGIGIRQNYPYWDVDAKEVVTLELAINRCREANGEEPLKWEKGDIAYISGYMAYTSRGNEFNLTIPNDDALAAYEEGKEFYYAKRGYLNNSCATCHVQGAGLKVRTEVLHAAIGDVTHTPIWRLKWGYLGTLQHRIKGCHRDQGTKPFKPQSVAYRNLEYFISMMSNGMIANGPAVRK